MIDTDYEIEQLTLEWDGDWANGLLGNLVYYYGKNSDVSDAVEELTLRNIVEAIYSIDKLYNSELSGYTDNMISNMRKALNILNELSKMDSPLRNNFAQLASGIEKYLKKQGKSSYSDNKKPKKDKYYYPYYPQDESMAEMREMELSEYDRMLDNIGYRIMRELGVGEETLSDKKQEYTYADLSSNNLERKLMATATLLRLDAIQRDKSKGKK